MISSLLIAAILGAAPAVEAGGNESQRAAVAKAIGFLDGAGAKLEKDASCINCHHAPLRFWALREAERAGVTVDVKGLVESTKTQVKNVLELKDDYRDKQWGHSLSSYFLLGAAEQDALALDKESAGNLLQIIVAEQRPDGSWTAAQQFGNQRRPKKDANEAQTIWSLLALARLEPSEPAQAAREKGLKWLASTEPGTTIDTRALRLLVERRWGTPERTDERLAAFLKSQRPDGGWGWQPDDASDAWATGLALFALSSLGDKLPAAAVENAKGFLAKTQREDGSWLVEGKLTKNSDMASYFGTAWAIIGLARTMPNE